MPLEGDRSPNPVKPLKGNRMVGVKVKIDSRRFLNSKDKRGRLKCITDRKKKEEANKIGAGNGTEGKGRDMQHARCERVVVDAGHPLQQ